MTINSKRYEDNIETIESWSKMNPSLKVYLIRDLFKNYNILEDIGDLLHDDALDLSFVGFFTEMTIEKTTNEQDIYVWKGRTNDGQMIHRFTLEVCPENKQNCITYTWDSGMFYLLEVYSSDGMITVIS